MHANAFSLAASMMTLDLKGVNNIFSNQFEIQELPETRTSYMEPFHLICFRTSPRLLQLLSRILKRCFSVTLQKCYEDHRHQGEELMIESIFFGKLIL